MRRPVWIVVMCVLSGSVGDVGRAAEKTEAVENVAHRGFSSQYRENSLAAITNAWALGEVRVEIDLRQVKGGSIVVFHDRSVGDIDLELLSHARLEARAGHEVLRFADALNALKNDHSFLLDMKGSGSSFVTRLLADVAAAKVGDDVLIFQSRFPDDLKVVQAARPEAQCFLVHSLSRKGLFKRRPSAESLARILERNGLQGISIKGREVIDDAYVETLKEDGRRVFVWTLNSPERMRHYLDLGADGVITDVPDVLGRLLAAP